MLRLGESGALAAGGRKVPSPASCERVQYDAVGRLAAQGKGGVAGLLCPGLLLPINSRSATSTASDEVVV